MTHLWQMLERKVPMAGVPHHKVDVYLRTLLEKGIAVVKQDQAIPFVSHALPCIFWI